MSFCCCEIQPVVLGDEKCQSAFYDVTTRMLCFCTARQLSTDPESPEISCRQENSRLVTRSHIFVFVVTAFSAVPSCLIHICTRPREGSFFRTLCLKTFHLGTVCVCLAWSSPLPRYCCCVDFAFIAIWIPDISFFLIVKVETGDSQDLKYGVDRVTRPPLLRCRLTWAGLERARVCARLGQNRAEDLGKPLRWHGFPRSPQHHKCSAVDGREPWDPKWRGCPRKRCGAGLGQGRFLLLCASSLMLAAKASLFWKACCSVIGPWLPKSPRSETSKRLIDS